MVLIGLSRSLQIGCWGKRADGLLASVTGEERFLTLGCGHTAAFCKLALEGGVTTQESLSDGDEGHMHDGVRCRFIALHKLTSNENFKSMIDEGWRWTVVSHEVDDEFPAFAKIAPYQSDLFNFSMRV